MHAMEGVQCHVLAKSTGNIQALRERKNNLLLI